MWCVLGLGNPGPEYEHTPHNLGFRVIDRLAELLRAGEFKRDSRALVTSAKVRDEEILLAKPLTYMNLSGESAVLLREQHGFKPSRMLVIYDDLDLPLGGLRLRPGGGHGGHKGMISLIEELHTTSFPRLRMGIHTDLPKDEKVDYLLSPFPVELDEPVGEAINRAAKAVRMVLFEGVQRAMNKVNLEEKQRMEE